MATHPSKEMTPFGPVYRAEFVEDVPRAAEMGITMVHLHARGEATGQLTQRAYGCGRVIESVRRFSPDLVICAPLSRRNAIELRARAEPLQLNGSIKPDIRSLTLSSLDSSYRASINAPETIKALA